MKVGIFSGSFNPIHIGHLILANYIAEFTEIDEVWLLVSPQNPFKVNDNLPDENIRLEMVKLAVEDYPKIKASSFEFSLPRPSYTVNTLAALKKEYPENEFVLIVGADNWCVFENWKNSDEIVEKYKLKVYPRQGYRIAIPSKMKKNVEAVDSPIIEISSTFIRENIRAGKNMRSFLPDKIYDYIIEKKLYQ